MSNKKLNLDNLTRDQKLNLLDLIEEKKRRLRDKQAVYKPNEGQALVHKSDKQVRCVFAGNGSGKSSLLVNEVLWACQGYNPILKTFTPVPARVIVLLSNPDKISESFLPELQKWCNLRPDQLHKRGKNYYSQITFDNGSEILFLSHQMEPLVFESIELDMMAADEPFPKAIWIAMRRGGRKKNRKSKFLIVGTPIAAAWMRTDLYDPWSKGELDNTECFKFGTIVNEKNLSSGYIKEFSAILSPKERMIRLEGAFFDLDGLALAHLFKQPIHVIDPFEWPSYNPVVIAIDPHPSKRHFSCMLGVDQEGYLYYIKELSEKLVPREFARALKKWYQGYNVIDIVCDSLGSSEGTGGEDFKSFISVLQSEGVRARATTFNEKSDEDFIARIQDVLLIPDQPNTFGDKIPTLRVFRGNHGIVADIENVAWTKYRNMDEYKPKLNIGSSDYLACLKYALSCNLSFNKSKSRIYKSQASTYGQPTSGTGHGYRKLYRR